MVYSADGFGQRTVTLKNVVWFTDDRGNDDARRDRSFRSCPPVASK
jgi:hypothetical protein